MFERDALNRFVYWIDERVAIHVKRSMGLSPPWSDDPVFQTVFFTNPYREWDKTTIWFRENIRDRFNGSMDVLMSTVIFRWFNLIRTGQFLLDASLIPHWDYARATSELTRRWYSGERVFTSAYIIQAGLGSKIGNVCRCIERLWLERHSIYAEMMHDGTLEGAHKILRRYPYLGGFMAYELVTDLRHTHILSNASDVMTWSHPGPGASRGLRRLLGLPFRGLAPANSLELMRELLPHCPDDFELREVEHSLCEFDKYERVRTGQGRSKRHFKGALHDSHSESTVCRADVSPHDGDLHSNDGQNTI